MSINAAKANWKSNFWGEKANSSDATIWLQR